MLLFNLVQYKPIKRPFSLYLTKVKNWCPLKFKNKVIKIYLPLFTFKTFQGEWILAVTLSILFSISHPATNTKMFRLSCCWTNFFIYCTFAQKKINNHVFKMMLPTVKFVLLPFLKNACHRKTSAWLTANSENNYPDTTILACENEMDKKGLCFNAHLNALAVLVKPDRI